MPPSVETTPTTGHLDLFREALDRYRKDIVSPSSRNDRDVFSHSTFNDALGEIRRAERKCAKESRTRKCAERLKPFLMVVERYSGIVDTCIQYDPNPSALIWGGLKLVVKVAGDYALYFAGLVEMIENVMSHFPRLDDYAKVFPEGRLRAVIISAYTYLIKFLIMANRAFSTPGLKVLIKSLWKPLNKELETTRKSLENLINLADVEFAVISTTRAETERLHQTKERVSASEERNFQEKERRKQETERIEAEAERQIQAKQRDARQKAEEEQLRFDVMAWLSRSDTTSAYTDALSKHALIPESCSWIYETQAYHHWARESEVVNSLWINSGPGTGKTVLASHIIRMLQEEYDSMNAVDPTAALAFFFCNALSAKSDSLAAIRTLLCQLLDYLPSLPQEIFSEYQESRKKGIGQAFPLTLTDLEGLFFPVLRRFKTSCIIVDGLDEYEDRESVLQFLMDLSQADSIANLHILVTSRAEPDIVKTFGRFQVFKIRPSDTKHDILGFIGNSISTITNLESKRRDKTVKILSKKASGLFIWVRLVVELLRDAATSSEFDEILETIPRGLHQIYCLIIERLDKRLLNAPSSRKEMARAIFRWLSLAPRPLHLDELREAVAIAAAHKLRSNNGVSKLRKIDDLKPSKDAIMDICGTIVEYDDLEGSIRLFHHTAREFLTNAHNEWSVSDVVRAYIVALDTGHALIAEECFLVIMAMPHTATLVKTLQTSGDFSCTREILDVEEEGRYRISTLLEARTAIVKHFPLFGYACRQFPFHMGRCPGTCSNEALRLFASLNNSNSLLIWLFGWIIFHPHRRIPNPKQFRRLKKFGIAASTWFGRIDFLCQGIRRKASLESLDEMMRFLQYAEVLGALENNNRNWIASYLSIDGSQEQQAAFDTAFAFAVETGHIDAARTLLTNKSWVDRHCERALTVACEDDNTEMFQLAFDNIKWSETGSSAVGQAFTFALKHGRVAIVRYLITQRNWATNADGQTLGNLLEGRHWPTLCVKQVSPTAYKITMEIFRLIICDINWLEVMSFYIHKKAFILAVELGRVDMARLFLQRSPYSMRSWEIIVVGRALSTASRRNDIEMVELLLGLCLLIKFHKHDHLRQCEWLRNCGEFNNISIIGEIARLYNPGIARELEYFCSSRWIGLVKRDDHRDAGLTDARSLYHYNRRLIMGGFYDIPVRRSSYTLY